MTPVQCCELVGLDDIGLGAHDQARTVEQIGLVAAEFAEQHTFLFVG